MKKLMSFINNFAGFVKEKNAQISLEYILLLGGTLAAAIIVVGVHKSLKELANTTEDWVELERNRTISEIVG